MHRRLSVLTAVAVFSVVLSPTETAWASETDSPIVVVPGDPVGRAQPPSVGIGVSNSGRAGNPGSSGGGGGSQAAKVSTGPLCVWVRTAVADAGLVAEPTDPLPGSSLYVQVCDGVSTGVVRWLTPGQLAAMAAPVAPVLPAAVELAQRAYGELVLPVPTPGRSPDLRLATGQAALLVGEHTWLWTTSATFSDRRRTERAGPVWATVTAEPVSLSFDPGTGEPGVVCVGAGTPFRPGVDGEHAASPTCDVVLSRSSAGMSGGTSTAVWSIRWRVSWVGQEASGASVSGTLADMTSATAVTVAVAEAQALVTG